MKIEQFEDKNLSHYSYAILCEDKNEVVFIDPARDPKPYYDFAQAHKARIIGVIETHPHADFVSSHLQIHQQTGAKIFVSKLMDPAFSYIPFDEGGTLEFGTVKLKAINTPGHSPDSISVVLEHEGKDIAVFTGDTLFIGDCGRPDLREQGEDMDLKREALAKEMYSSLRYKLMLLQDDLIVYPAHGAGTLCGKALSNANSSTIGAEKATNWSLQEMPLSEFIATLTGDQPFIPKYFPYDVDLNKIGAPGFKESLGKVILGQKVDSAEKASLLDAQLTIIDTRDAEIYKKGHLKNAINIMDGEKFETWLGALVTPGDPFYLAAANDEALAILLERTAKIGYEVFIEAAFVLDFGAQNSNVVNPEASGMFNPSTFDAASLETSAKLDFEAFKKNPEDYTIVDVRNKPETENEPAFKRSINIPLPELNERFHEIPTNKPIVVHCAAGYRSAAASSILEQKLRTTVYDLSDRIKQFITS